MSATHSVFAQDEDENEEENKQKNDDKGPHKSIYGHNIFKVNIPDLLFAGNAGAEYERYINDDFSAQLGFIYGFSPDKTLTQVNLYRQVLNFEITGKWYYFGNDFNKKWSPVGTYFGVFFRYGIVDTWENPDNPLSERNPKYPFKGNIYWPGLIAGRQWVFSNWSFDIFFAAGYRFTAFDNEPFEPKPTWQISEGFNIRQFAGIKFGLSAGYNF